MQFEYACVRFSLPLPGFFNAMNALAAIKLCEALGIPLSTAAAALKKLPVVRGRLERIETGQDFTVIVDYAHTPDSLRALFGAFENRRKICVLGNTGGGRDTWKRPEMGKIADEECEKVILTNEDPYDEDPRTIVDAMVCGMAREPEIIMDRRLAIRRALQVALALTKGIPPESRDKQKGLAVLLTGKGTDPFIMGAHGAKIPWSDADVVREELKHLKPQS
jgi:UDP-N-acetylmuramoyl-L-alanyl-D-glutamate--2,6-diaminopimelate ligase